MSKFDFKTYVRKLLQESLDEGGYFGQGTSVNGAASFHGTYYGFGGDKQLATEPIDAVKKLKKQRDKEAVDNIENQMRRNRGYPANKSVSGFPGGESGAGINSGLRIPNSISQIAIPAGELEDIFNIDDPKRQYWGFNPSDDEEENRGLEEQLGGPGGGPVRGSDHNYRDGQGFPRHNTIEKSVDFVPDVQNDHDGDGEEDVYLTDEEYLNDVLRLNGLDVQSGQLKRIFSQDSLEESVLQERTLYHGTSNEHLASIKKYGLTGELGDWVKDSYGMQLDPEDWEEHLEGVTFATDRANIHGAVGAMRYHVGKKLDKWLGEVDEDDLRRHGMLVVIRDVEEPKEIEYPEDVEDEEWYHRPKDDEASEKYPMSVEPGDWFIKGGASIDDVLIGNKMIQFLRRTGGLKNIESDQRRQLIKLAVAYHGPRHRAAVVKKVQSLPEHEVTTQLRNYKEMAGHIISQQKKERSGGETQKHRGKQLSFTFEEAALSLKNVFINNMKSTMVSEASNYTSPGLNLESYRSTERYKQGDWLEDHEPGATKKLIKHVDHTGGHTSVEPAETSPGAQTYGNVAFPKKFVPDDWEQRHPMTKEEDIDMDDLKEFVSSVVREVFEETYTGIDDETGDGEPKGGSAAFEKNKKDVLDYDKKNKPDGEKDG